MIDDGSFSLPPAPPCCSHNNVHDRSGEKKLTNINSEQTNRFAKLADSWKQRFCA